MKLYFIKFKSSTPTYSEYPCTEKGIAITYDCDPDWEFLFLTESELEAQCQLLKLGHSDYSIGEIDV